MPRLNADALGDHGSAARGHGPTETEPAMIEDPLRPLVERARRGDVEAWARLYHELIAPITRHLRYLTGDADSAEDLAQETFARAMVDLPSFVGRSRFSTWLHGVALNAARRHWRKRRNGQRAFAQLTAIAIVREANAQGEPEQAAIQRRRAAALYELLQTLPEPLREAFILRDLEAIPLPEVAALLGISAGNVAVRASRARARIREGLARRGLLTG